jgi:uncharacterized protein (TIRG00374 family)
MADASTARPGVLARALHNRWLAWILAALVLVSIALWRTSPADLTSAFANVRYQWLAPVLLLYLAARVIAAWEWRFLLRKVGRAPIAGLLGATLIGTFVNAVLPANLGDVAKIQIAASRYALPRAGLVAGRGSEAIVNAMMFVMFALLSIALMRGSLSSETQRLLLILTVAGVAISIAAVAASRAIPKTLPQWGLVRRLPHPVRTMLAGQYPGFHDGFEVIRRPRLLSLLLLVNLLGWSIDLVIYWSYGNAFNVDLPLGGYLSVTLALAIITTMPITFGSIGTWELGVTSVLSLYGVPPERALAFAVGSHVIITSFNIGVGLLAMAMMGVRLHEVFQLRQKHAAPMRAPAAKDDGIGRGLSETSL